MSYIDVQFAELQSLVANLGKDGGLVSPSIYDTAQVIRCYPPPEGAQPAIEWLLQQQHGDGGWGEPSTPYARDVPTLAAILALHSAQEPTHQATIDAGLDFLEQQAEQWSDLPIDALPIATEMILPYLIEEANRTGLAVDCKPYARLYHLRDRKCRMISAKPLDVGSPPTYSWEALARPAHSISPDCSGGIGHSPAATAAWLAQAEVHPDLSDACTTARQYLQKAATATGVGIPGVVPNVWPITGFELTYGPYALLVTSLLHMPAMQKVIAPLLDELWRVMQHGHGVSFGEHFTADVDDTGLATAVLQATSRSVGPSAVLQFKKGDHFCTFHNELNPSLFANAHALYGLAHAGERHPTAEKFLRERQCSDGSWLADKLHGSWLYTTLEVVLALSHLGYEVEVQKAAEALVCHQHPNGGWGHGVSATRLETSYGLITLSTIEQRGLLDEAGKATLRRGYQWLNHIYHPYQLAKENLWLGKELYSPYRVDRVYELSALLSVTQEEVLL